MLGTTEYRVKKVRESCQLHFVRFESILNKLSRVLKVKDYMFKLELGFKFLFRTQVKLKFPTRLHIQAWIIFLSNKFELIHKLVD